MLRDLGGVNICKYLTSLKTKIEKYLKITQRFIYLYQSDARYYHEIPQFLVSFL